jgi:leucyl aminopeptidase (aminopeptidase T)
MLIHDPAALKALAAPLRLRVLNVLTDEQASVQQLALRLNEPHAKVFYHVKELAQHGLIEQVGESIKNGIVEKYYRAVAKTFFLGQTLGQHSDVAGAAEEAVTNDLLRHRRRDTLAVDCRRIAHDLVRNALGVRPGTRVIIEGASHQLDLLEAISLECRLAGGEAMIRLVSPAFMRSLLAELPATELAEAPPLTTFLYGNTDIWLSLDAVPASSAFADCAPEKVDALIAGELAAYRLGPKRFAQVLVGYPTAESAAELGIDYTDLYDQFWGALNVSVDSLRDLADQWRTVLRVGETLRAANRHGTRLAFTIGEPPAINAGTLAGMPEPSATSLTDLSLPGGQALIVPRPETVSGTVAVPLIAHRSGLVRGLRLKIEKGTVVGYHATEGSDLLPDLIGEPGQAAVARISVGFNPGAPKLTGYKFLDGICQDVFGIGLSRPDMPGELIGLEFWCYSPGVRLRQIDD